MKSPLSPLLDELRTLLGDRPFHAALLFSLCVHGAVLLLWKEWRTVPVKEGTSFVVVRLIKGSSANGDAEREEWQGTGQPSAPKTASNETEDEAGERRTAGGAVHGAGGASAAARGSVSSTAFAGEGAGSAALSMASAPVPAVGRLAVEPGQAVLARHRDALAEIRRRIDSKKRYPLMARKRGWEGSVLVEIELDGVGVLAGVKLLRESGYPLLDRATLTAVREAGPYPPLPGRVRVPISFSLTEGQPR